jgi:hypothetical protein
MQIDVRAQGLRYSFLTIALLSFHLDLAVTVCCDASNQDNGQLLFKNILRN